MKINQNAMKSDENFRHGTSLKEQFGHETLEVHVTNRSTQVEVLLKPVGRRQRA